MTTDFLLRALAATGLSFLILAAVFWPLEKLFPMRSQKIFRPQWWTDLFFFAGQYLLWNGLIFWGLAQLQGWLDIGALAGFRQVVAAQPWWLQALEIIVLSDVAIYWGHRLQHRVEFLWRFHSIHHCAEHLDWLAAHREHPLDTVYTLLVLNLPPMLLGFPLETLAGLLAFRGLWAIYIHSNAKLPVGPLKYLLGAPELHHWHHDRARDAGNYGNVSPLTDLVFGTHVDPGHPPESYGIKEEVPKTYWGQLWHPFRSRRKPAARA